MAYMSQEKKALIAHELKKIMPKSWKYSLGVNHHSTIVLTIAAAPVDLIAEWNRVCQENHHGPIHIPFQPAKDHIQVNEYYLQNQFDKSLPKFKAIKDCLNAGNHDRSDMMTDYFDVGWYVSINIGRWNKPFICTGNNSNWYAKNPTTQSCATVDVCLAGAPAVNGVCGDAGCVCATDEAKLLRCAELEKENELLRGKP